MVQGGEGTAAANRLGSSNSARVVAAVQLRVTRHPHILTGVPPIAHTTAIATATPVAALPALPPASAAVSGRVPSAHTVAAESLSLCARVRGGRFCRRAVLLLAPPQGAACHRIELHGHMLDADGLAFGGEVNVWFEVQTIL